MSLIVRPMHEDAKMECVCVCVSMRQGIKVIYHPQNIDNIAILVIFETRYLV